MAHEKSNLTYIQSFILQPSNMLFPPRLQIGQAILISLFPNEPIAHTVHMLVANMLVNLDECVAYLSARVLRQNSMVGQHSF